MVKLIWRFGSISCVLTLVFLAATVSISTAQQHEMSKNEVGEGSLTKVTVAADSLSETNKKEFLERWRNVDIIDVVVDLPDSCLFPNQMQATTQFSDMTMKVGVPYFMIHRTDNSVLRALQLFAAPNKALAQKEMHAYKLGDIEPQLWPKLRREVATKNSDDETNVDFSLLVSAQDGFIGVPIKWNGKSAGALQKAYGFSSQSPRHDMATILAVGAVGNSLLWIDSFQNAVSGGTQPIKQDNAARFNPCDYANNARPDREAFLAFSFQPAVLETIDSVPIVTNEGLIKGAALGTSYPVWASVDEDSPTLDVSEYGKNSFPNED